MAAPASINDLTSLIAVTEIVQAIISIAGVFVGIYVLFRGAEMILAITRGDDHHVIYRKDEQGNTYRFGSQDEYQDWIKHDPKDRW